MTRITNDRVNKYSKRGIFKLGDGYDFYIIDFKPSKNLYVFEDHFLEHVDNHSIIITQPKKIHPGITGC
ncbi:MAG: hypothetical protein RLZZ540_657 [Bacteroidota bacterium]|jgi:hypothetical protein